MLTDRQISYKGQIGQKLLSLNYVRFNGRGEARPQKTATQVPNINGKPYIKSTYTFYFIENTLNRERKASKVQEYNVWVGDGVGVIY